MENNLPTSWEEICQIKGIDPNHLPDVSLYPDNHKLAAIATFKWYHILDVLNTDTETKELWKPDWANWNERKYINWFDMSAEGEVAGFGFFDTLYDSTRTDASSHLYFKDKETAIHAKNHFFPILRDIMVIS